VNSKYALHYIFYYYYFLSIPLVVLLMMERERERERERRGKIKNKNKKINIKSANSCMLKRVFRQKLLDVLIFVEFLCCNHSTV
jgi:hypothetical protein